MINISELYNDPCKKLDAWCIDAFFELSLDPFKPTDLTLDNSWAPTTVDLTPAIKAGETITNLLLTDTALQFNREDYGRDGVEDGGLDCIPGDDLSHIISMKYLRDVAQPPTLTNGDVYMWNDNSQLFEVFNLQDFVDTTNQRLDSLENRMTNLENKLDAFITQTNQTLSNIFTTIKRPSGIPEDTVIAWSNINQYNDYTNTGQRGHGIYSHSTSITIPDDTYDAQCSIMGMEGENDLSPLSILVSKQVED